MQVVTFSELRSHLKEIMDMTIDRHEPVFVRRSGGKSIVVLSAEDYASLDETHYLLSDEANAEHLRKSLRNFRSGKIIKKSLIDK